MSRVFVMTRAAYFLLFFLLFQAGVLLGAEVSRIKLNTFLGVNILRSTGVVSGAQLGYAPSRKTRVYIGPEVNFSVFSKGSLLMLLGGGRFEAPIGKNLRIIGGALSGVGIASALADIAPTSFVFFFDSSLAHEVSKLVSIQGQLRPGFVDKNFAFMINFNVSFRF